MLLRNIYEGFGIYTSNDLETFINSKINKDILSNFYKNATYDYTEDDKPNDIVRLHQLNKQKELPTYTSANTLHPVKGIIYYAYALETSPEIRTGQSAKDRPIGKFIDNSYAPAIKKIEESEKYIEPFKHPTRAGIEYKNYAHRLQFAIHTLNYIIEKMKENPNYYEETVKTTIYLEPLKPGDDEKTWAPSEVTHQMLTPLTEMIDAIAKTPDKVYQTIDAILSKLKETKRIILSLLKNKVVTMSHERNTPLQQFTRHTHRHGDQLAHMASIAFAHALKNPKTQEELDIQNKFIELSLNQFNKMPHKEYTHILYPESSPTTNSFANGKTFNQKLATAISKKLSIPAIQIDKWRSTTNEPVPINIEVLKHIAEKGLEKIIKRSKEPETKGQWKTEIDGVTCYRFAREEDDQKSTKWVFLPPQEWIKERIKVDAQAIKRASPPNKPLQIKTLRPELRTAVELYIKPNINTETATVLVIDDNFVSGGTTEIIERLLRQSNCTNIDIFVPLKMYVQPTPRN